jgi:RHS repeat-associated protein
VTSRFVERTYDDFDRIESERVPLENGGIATIRYTYWPDGRRKTLTDALGRVTFYEYDGRARLSRVTANQGLPDQHVTTYTYFPDGLLRTITKPNGTVTSYDYDRADRLTSVVVRAGPTVLLAYEYTYDPNGNRLTQVETNGGAPETTTYTYDDLNRLETVTYPDGVAVAYEYDPVGNRTRETTRSAAGVIVSDKRAAFDAINRLSSITDSVDPSQNATLAYDRNGNLVSKTTAAGTEEYSYDTRDFLVETRSGASITAHFAFDAFGRRYLKVGVDGTRQYLYDETSTLQELDGDDAEVAKYEYGGDRLLSLAHRGEPRRYYEQDGLGTPVALTDAAGSVVARYHLDAWGRYRFPTELDASANRFGFTGYLFDQETDLYYAKARFYDPELGRFTTQDSVLGEVDEPPSLNRYGYAWGNPLLFVDPEGHAPQSPNDAVSQEQLDAWAEYNRSHPVPERQPQAVTIVEPAPAAGCRGPLSCWQSLWSRVRREAVESGQAVGRNAIEEHQPTSHSVAVAEARKALADRDATLSGTAARIERANVASGVRDVSGEVIGEGAGVVVDGSKTYVEGKAIQGAVQVAGVFAARALLRRAPSVLGAEGEALVMRHLESKGYTDIRAIQNASNHGIDIVARNAKGELRFFEVKATETLRNGRLTKAQQYTEEFITTRLRQAALGQGHWKNIDPESQAEARNILKELVGGAPIRGMKVDVRFPEAGHHGPPSLRVSRWRDP